MTTTIKVNENYEVINKKVSNKKPVPNKLLDTLIPILKEAKHES